MDFLSLRIIVVIHLYFNVQLGDIYFVITKYFGSGWEFGGLFSLYFAGFFFICFCLGFFLINFLYHLFQIISYIFLINSILHVFI